MSERKPGFAQGDDALQTRLAEVLSAFVDAAGPAPRADNDATHVGMSVEHRWIEEARMLVAAARAYDLLSSNRRARPEEGWVTRMSIDHRAAISESLMLTLELKLRDRGALERLESLLHACGYVPVGSRIFGR